MIRPLIDDGLRGRVALITGGGRGIGRGAAVGLARRGARVAIVDITDDELLVTARLAEEQGAEVLPVRADLRRRDEIDHALSVVQDAWSLPEILVNNAAVLHLKPFEETDPVVWDETLRVDLEAGYYLTWRLYSHMCNRARGHIISVSSNAGVRPFALETAYCAAKYAVEGLYRSLALEATARGLIIILGTPGRTTKPTSMTDAAFAALPEEQRNRYVGAEAFAEAFGYLSGTSDPSLSGRRFDLFALSELVRELGWAVPGWLALQKAERNFP